jgi:hypothetical protein
MVLIVLGWTGVVGKMVQICGFVIFAGGGIISWGILSPPSLQPPMVEKKVGFQRDTTGAAIAVAGGPVAVAVAAGAAWVVNTPAGGQPGNNVQPISLLADTAGKPIMLPKGAQNIAIAPNGRTAWVVCLNSDELVPVGLVSRRAGTAISVPGGPFAVTVANQAKAGAAPIGSTTSTVAKKKKK